MILNYDHNFTFDMTVGFGVKLTSNQFSVCACYQKPSICVFFCFYYIIWKNSTLDLKRTFKNFRLDKQFSCFKLSKTNNNNKKKKQRKQKKKKKHNKTKNNNKNKTALLLFV